MDIAQIIQMVLGLLVVLSGGYFVKARNAIKEVSEVMAALQDVLTDTEGETQSEKLADIKKLGTEATEALQAIKGLFIIKK